MVIELREVGLLSGHDVLGRVHVPLQRLMERGRIREDFRLEPPEGEGEGEGEGGDADEEEGDVGGRGVAAVELVWVGTFE